MGESESGKYAVQTLEVQGGEAMTPAKRKPRREPQPEEKLERQIVSLSLELWHYGCFIGEWNEAEAEMFQRERREVETGLHVVITALAHLKGMKHKEFSRIPASTKAAKNKGGK